jgi:hypothetical protein
VILKLIACEVFTREACHCIASSPHRVDVEFTEKGAHNDSAKLRTLLQEKIDAAEAAPQAWDAILLGYGLCGNSTVGLTARTTRLVVPRAHDCCTIFLGSRGKFREHFKDNPSLPFSSVGYAERGWTEGSPAEHSFFHEPGTTTSFLLGGRTWEQYAEQFGEENARYIVETLNASVDRSLADQGDNRVVFIQVPEFSHLGYAERARAEAEASGRKFLELPGDLRLVRKLVHGEWDPEEFLVVRPGRKIAGVYDWDRIVIEG